MPHMRADAADADDLHRHVAEVVAVEQHAQVLGQRLAVALERCPGSRDSRPGACSAVGWKISGGSSLIRGVVAAMLGELGEQELRHVLFRGLLEALLGRCRALPPNPSPSGIGRRRSCRTRPRAPASRHSRPCARGSCARLAARGRAPRRFRAGRIWRPATTTLAARRLTSHSHGAGRVSSKSLMSKTSGARAWRSRRSSTDGQSPQACTRMPDGGRRRQVGRHDRGRAAVEGERRLHHAAVADRHELRHPARVRLVQEVDDVPPALGRLPVTVRLARDRLAQRLALAYAARRAARTGVLRARRRSVFS